MKNCGDFLTLGEKMFFTFIHSDNRQRSFSYSGILDVDCAGNGSSLIINHTNTQIIINGSGLELLHKHITDEKVKFVFGNEKSYKITEIFYKTCK